MDQTRLLDRLRSQCSRREYCEADIRRKISAEEAKCGFPLGADAILASLKADTYLSDARFAEAFARDKSSLDGWGSLKIRCALQARGLAKADIDAGLAAIDEASASGRL